MAASLSLADLNESVDYVDASQRRGDCQTWPLDSMLTVARRVAALYDTCRPCGGQGWDNPQPAIDGERETCPNCFGLGLVLSEAGRGAFYSDPAWEGSPYALARYLFGDTP